MIQPNGAGSADLLKVRDLSVVYRRGARRVQAVVDVSFDVKQGSTMALIGESGSGKTSIARAICGLIPTEGGSILIDGKELTEAGNRPAAAGRWGVQIVFQDPVASLDPRWPSWRSIAEPLVPIISSAEQRRARAYELLERVGINRSLAERRPLQLSGGQRQRVTVARAIAPS
ncbi:MAG: ATP-binding cassette domain-containing protein, partial [Candidatus Dormibacteraeota bacterium]|nr:ATP-binding cassette domain-containing protein [Candidatus Dormibacteraeota bacterium]